MCIRTKQKRHFVCVYAVAFSFHAGINLWSKVIFVRSPGTRISVHYTYNGSAESDSTKAKSMQAKVMKNNNHMMAAEGKRGDVTQRKQTQLTIRIFRSRKLFIVLLSNCIRYGNFMSGATLENAEQKPFVVVLLLYFIIWKCCMKMHSHEKIVCFCWIFLAEDQHHRRHRPTITIHTVI